MDQVGVFDEPALASEPSGETQHPCLGEVSHSTQTTPVAAEVENLDVPGRSVLVLITPRGYHPDGDPLPIEGGDEFRGVPPDSRKISALRMEKGTRNEGNVQGQASAVGVRDI